MRLTIGSPWRRRGGPPRIVAIGDDLFDNSQYRRRKKKICPSIWHATEQNGRDEVFDAGFGASGGEAWAELAHGVVRGVASAAMLRWLFAAPIRRRASCCMRGSTER